MKKLPILIMLNIFLFFTVLLIPQISLALPMSYTDNWDLSQGNIIDATSGELYYSSSYKSDIRKMFGQDSYSGTLGGPLMFKDYMLPNRQGGSVQAGYIHYVEWHTPSEMTLRSFNLVSYNEGMDRRAFDRFELFANVGGSWQSLYTQYFAASSENPYGYGGSPTYTPDTNWLELEVDLTVAVNAQYFRAEFRQAIWTDYLAIGPRVYELDGYDTFLDGSTGTPVPEPTTMLLLGTGLISLAGFRRKFRRK